MLLSIINGACCFPDAGIGCLSGLRRVSTLTKEKKIMKLQEIKAIAQRLEIPVRKMTKAELVRAIQKKEQNTECFETGAAAECGQDKCLWADDCK
jgi:hypothetical protein